MDLSLGHDEDQQEGPALTGRPLLFALVNLPALLLLAWLTAGWLTDSPLLERSHAARLFRLACVTAVLAGNCLLFVLVWRALRATREHRDHLHGLVETAADAILTFDQSGCILSSNPAGTRMFGYRPGELLGQPITRVLPDVHAGTALAATDDHCVLGATRTIEALRKDGSCFSASLGISKVRQAGRDLTTAIVHDLTPIQAASRAKSSFLLRTSHEVRTPLGGILGMAELLRDSGLDPEQQQRLDVIQQSAEAVLALFDQVIDYARLEAGDCTLVRHPFSLHHFLDDTLAALAPLAQGKGLPLRLEVARDLPSRLRGDPLRLGQVLGSLVGNAIKFTASGEVVVTVSGAAGGVALVGLEEASAKPQAAEEVTLDFEVRDTGVGIPAEQLERIFEPFEQGDTSSTRQHGGVGLGLSLAARLVHLMGGHLDVRSQPGQGSSFRFRLSVEAAEPGPGDGQSVLLALASDSERRRLETLLTGWGHEVVGVSTGRTALAELVQAVVEGCPFGLVLIEEHLPDLSAREVLHRLQQRSGATPPAILLGRSEHDLPMPAGIAAVLPHCAAPLQLREVVQQLGGLLTTGAAAGTR
jgi:PAS domain S-box-containing protein